MSQEHNKFHFSITCGTEDVAVMYCFRSLCQLAERHPMKQIGWGGTGDAEWRAAGDRITLRFTHPEFRDLFVSEADRLFPGMWTECSRSDSDPARPQRLA